MDANLAPKCSPPGSIRTALDVNIDNGNRWCGMCATRLPQAKLGENCPACLYKLGWWQIMTDCTAIGDHVAPNERALAAYIKKYKEKQVSDSAFMDGPEDGY